MFGTEASNVYRNKASMSKLIDGLNVHWVDDPDGCKNIGEAVRLFNLTSRVPLTSGEALPYLQKANFDVKHAMEMIRNDHCLIEETKNAMVLVYTGEPRISTTSDTVIPAHSGNKLMIRWNVVTVLMSQPPIAPELIDKVSTVLEEVRNASRKRPRQQE
jgi:hypothetical protein